MNERIKELALQAGYTKGHHDEYGRLTVMPEFNKEKFAELIVEECRTVIVELYRKTSLELCGPLLTADEKIAEHFYGVE